MDVRDFSSILEVFTGLNFAFVISNGFINQIEENFSTHLNNLKTILSEINSKMEGFSQQLTEIQPMVIGGSSTKSSIINHVNTLEEYKKKYEGLKKESETSLTVALNKNEFNPLCLYSSLYCILFLLISPINYINNLKMIYVYLFLTGIVWVSLTIFCNKFSKKPIILFLSHLSSMKAFAMTLIISVLLTLIYPTLLTGLTLDIFLYLSIAFPSIHFVYYFFIVVQEKNNICHNPLGKIKEFETQCNEECWQKIQKLVKTHTEPNEYLQSIITSDPETSK